MCPCLWHFTQVQWAQKVVFRLRRKLDRKERHQAKHTGCACCDPADLEEYRRRQLALLQGRGLRPDPAAQKQLREESVDVWVDRYFKRANPAHDPRRRSYLKLPESGVACRRCSLPGRLPASSGTKHEMCIMQFEALYHKLQNFVHGVTGRRPHPEGAIRHWTLGQLEERHPVMARAFWAGRGVGHHAWREG